jgi:hypothetical protein
MLSNPRPLVMKTILAVALIGLILSSHPVIGAGGLEVEVGDVQRNENKPLLKQRKQSPNAKQDEMEKSWLKALDEKLRKAEEEGNRQSAEDSGSGSDFQNSRNSGGVKP